MPKIRMDILVKKKLILVAMLVLVILSGVGGFLLAGKLNSSEETKDPMVDVSYVTGKLDVISELTTAELTYTGLVKYEDGEIPFLTKKGFSMIYTATAKAGINFSDIEVQVDDDKVTVILPQADILSVQVDADSIQFYDEQYALFNPNEKTDITDTISKAEADVYENMDITGLKNKANNQTKELITEFLKDSIGERDLEVIISEDVTKETSTESKSSSKE